MRTPVLLESWWKRTVFGEVAEYSLTGTLTSPKLIAPDQIARAIYIFVYPMPRARQSAERVLAARRGYLRRPPRPAGRELAGARGSRARAPGGGMVEKAQICRA